MILAASAMAWAVIGKPRASGDDPIRNVVKIVPER